MSLKKESLEKKLSKRMLVPISILISAGFILGAIYLNRINRARQAKMHSLYETRQFSPVYAEQNSNIYVFAVGHAAAFDTYNKDNSVVEKSTERFIATFSSLKQQGIEDIVLEGLTPEDAERLAQTQKKQGRFFANINARGAQKRQASMIINCLLQSGWHMHAGEDTQIRAEMNKYHDKVRAIRKRYIKQMTDELNEASKEDKDLPQEFLTSIGNKYQKKINSDTNAYLWGEEGARFYDLSTNQRTKIMIRNIEEKARQGKKVVFWGGAAHGAQIVLALREKGIPITLYSNIIDFNPDTFKYTRKEFVNEVFGGIGEISFEK